MTEPVTERTYLDMLRDELIQMRAKRAIIQGYVDSGDDGDYFTKILANWDYDIAQQEKRIERERAS